MSKEVKENERKFSLKIVEYLNHNHNLSGYFYTFFDSYCDIADEKNEVYIEVKIDSNHFAFAQLFAGIVKANKVNAKLLGLADNKQVKFYRAPEFKVMKNFIKFYDPTFSFSPSKFDNPEKNNEAEKLLGKPIEEIKFKFQESDYYYITPYNIEEVISRVSKDKIEIKFLLDWLDGVKEEPAILMVNSNGILINTEDINPFRNTLGNKETTLYTYKITNKNKLWITTLRIKHENLLDLYHRMDELLEINKRRENGVFWTKKGISYDLANEIMDMVEPEYVVEPCVGGGSLISPIISNVHGTVNDIDEFHVQACKKAFDGYGWKFTALNVVTTPTEKLIKEWEIPENKRLLIYTNPPFGASSRNKLSSKKSELNGELSHKINITYSEDLLKYGKGDLFIPVVGRLIEIAKAHKNSYIAFFAPFGLYCGRKRYNKLLNLLLKDFTFLNGYVYSGLEFQDVSKDIPIAITIWKYTPNVNTKHLNLTFQYRNKNERREVKFKEMLLLKDGWKYGAGNYFVKEKNTNAIIAPSCDRFNTPILKIFSTKEQNGAEVSPDNVMIKLNISGISSELAYSLWSYSVGNRSFESISNRPHPVYFIGAYTHLPDFTKKEVIEILAYSALSTMYSNFTEGRIGFIGLNKIFKFGNEKYTKEVWNLLQTYHYLPMYDNYTLGDILEIIKDNKDKIDATKYSNAMGNQIASRLWKIGYWDYVPIPITKEKENTKNNKEIYSSTSQQNIFIY